MAPTRWNALDDADRAVFRDAAKRAAQAMRDDIDRSERDALAALRKAGMDIITVDRARFEAATAPVHADCARRFGQERIDRIRNYHE